jgi:hypothetical protein
MPIRQITVPFMPGYDFGIGVHLASGSPMGKVVEGEPTGVTNAGGASVNLAIQRIHTTSDLESALGIDAEASYGCGAFGASARLSFAEKSKVQSSSLFMTVTVQVELAFLSIDEPALTAKAASLVDRPDVFAARYGGMFVRGMASGGLFVGVLRFDTSSSEESKQISAELEGTYGLFSASAEMKLSKVQEKHHSEVFVQMYHEGGPVDLKIDDPTDPMQLLGNATKFLESFEQRPAEVARPYFFTLAPMEIAEGPLPLNPAEVQHAQDVIVFCAGKRSSLIDQLNLLEYVDANPSRFDFTNGASPEAVATAIGGVQADLDLVARCASRAVDHPSEAKMPVEFAQGEGLQFPSGTMPDPMPLASEGEQVTVPDFGGCISWQACQELGERSGLAVTQQEVGDPSKEFKVLSTVPPKGTALPDGSPVTILTTAVDMDAVLADVMMRARAIRLAAGGLRARAVIP